MNETLRREERNVINFKKVNFRTLGDMEIVQGNEEGLTIEALEEVLSRIVTEVNDGTLVISIKQDLFHWENIARRIHFLLRVKDLESFDFSGVGRIQADQLTADRLELNLRGAGDISIKNLKADELNAVLGGTGKIEVTGNVAEQEIHLKGAGAFQGGDLQCESARVTLRGVGDVTVRCSDVLDVKLSGLGSVHYYGDPIVRKSISGLGSLSHIQD
jgi:hypothetical protein